MTLARGKMPVLVPDSGIWYQNVPCWQKYAITCDGVGNITVTRPDGTSATVALTAGLTQDVVLFGLSTNAFVHATRIKSDVAATGVTTLTAKLGVAGADTLFNSSAFDLKAGVSATNFAPTTTTGSTVGNNTTAAIDFVVLLTSTVDNLSVITAGAFSVWVFLSALP